MQITQSGTGGINTFKTTGIRTGDGFISGDVGIGVRNVIHPQIRS